MKTPKISEQLENTSKKILLILSKDLEKDSLAMLTSTCIALDTILFVIKENDANFCKKLIDDIIKKLKET